MIIVWGTRLYGRIAACGTSFVATRFAHVWFIPLFPVGTQLVLEGTGTSYRGLPADFSFKSMLAGYLRVWGPLATLGAALMTASAASGADDALGLVIVGGLGGLVVLALAAASVLAFVVLGKLDPEEKRQRSVYAIHTGYFVDPADMGHARHSMRLTLLESLHERARGLAATGYRLSADPTQAWPHVALDPTVHDETFITSAFTLARIEASLATGPAKAQMEQIHARIWERISRANPPYLNAAANAG